MKSIYIVFALALLTVSGCSPSMPTKINYHQTSGASSNLPNVIDNRPEANKLFRIESGSDITYYYGDDSFRTSLVGLISRRLAVNLDRDTDTEISINKVTIAASINGTTFDQRTYDAATDSLVTYGGGVEEHVAKLFVKPILENFEIANDRRSIWCKIEYRIGNKNFVSHEVSSAKDDALEREVVSLFNETVDEMAKQIKIIKN